MTRTGRRRRCTNSVETLSAVASCEGRHLRHAADRSLQLTRCFVEREGATHALAESTTAKQKDNISMHTLITVSQFEKVK